MELGRWGADELKDTVLVNQVSECGSASLVTLLESQLCRSLRKKDREEVSRGVKKYLALYAAVPSDALLPLLLEEAQKYHSS